MPTSAEVMAEDYHWRVFLGDGSVLDEREECSERPGSTHVWACVSDTPVLAVELLDRAGRSACLIPVDPGEEPVFFRRRSFEMSLGGGIQRRLPTETHVGIRGRPETVLLGREA